MNIETLIAQEEGKQLEFKENLSSPKKILQTIVAFANTAGGTLLIGVQDETKKVTGINHPLKEEERLANLICDNIAPLLAPDIELINWRNIHLIKVDVSLSPNRPHFLKEKGLENGAFIRIGSTNRRIDEEMAQELKRGVLRKPFDETPLPEFDTEAIDFAAACDSFEGKKPLDKKSLETLNLITDHQSKKVPTVAGIILFGKNRETIFPDAWVQCGRFKGIDKTAIVDTQEIKSYPVLAIEEAMQFIQKHSNLAYEIKDVRRTETWNKPMTALREAIINALVHTDYSQSGAPVRLSIFDDRIEIENPGILVSGLTIDEIQQGVSKLRNKNIARVLKELGFVEQWGSGISKIMNSCQEYGLPKPHFEEIGTHFRITLYTDQTEPLALDDKEIEILNILHKEGSLPTKSIAHAIELSSKATVTRMHKLIKKGLVSVIGKNPQDPKRKYILTDNGVLHVKK